MDAQQLAKRRNPNLPILPSPQPLRIAVFFSNEDALKRYKGIATMPQMFAATEAIFAIYNLVLDMQPPLSKGFDDRVLGHPGRVRVAREQKTEQYIDYVTDANALGALADKKLKASNEQRVRLRVVVCEFNYTEAELREAAKVGHKSGTRSLTKGEALGNPTWSDPKDLPIILINLTVVPSFLDYRLVLPHEILHAAGATHTKVLRLKNLMNEGANSGYWLTPNQLKKLAAAPFCAP